MRRKNKKEKIDLTSDGGVKENFTIDENNIKLIIGDLIKKYPCQENLVKLLFYNIINNQYVTKNELENMRSVIFLLVSSGTGKTSITRDICKQLNIPFVEYFSDEFMPIGYEGKNINDILLDLLLQTNGKIEAAEKGIIVLDRIENIIHWSVEKQLSNLIEGKKYVMNIEDVGNFEFDTSKLTFIILGTLSKQNNLGFDKEGNNIEQYFKQNIFSEELTNKLNTYLYSKNYDKEDLYNILKLSTISPLNNLKLLAEAKGKKLEIEEEIYNLIVDKASKLNKGARGLEIVVNDLRTSILEQLFSCDNEIIYLNSGLFFSIYEKPYVKKLN